METGKDVLSIIHEYGLITEADVQEVLSRHQATGKSHGHILVESGILNEKQLYKFIVDELGMNPDFNYEDRKFNIAGLSIPRFQINGDFYGIFDLGEGKIAVTLSDVAGKGLEAGLLALRLAYLLRKEINLKTIVPATILNQINKASFEFFRSDKFATFIVFILDLYNGTAEYSCAGSPPILVYRHKQKAIESLEVAGIPIGILDDYNFPGRKLSLEKGDAVLFYTDGAYEVENLKGTMFGYDRIKEVFFKNATLPAKKIVQQILGKIKRFSFLKGLNDDTTFVAIRKID